MFNADADADVPINSNPTSPSPVFISGIPTQVLNATTVQNCHSPIASLRFVWKGRELRGLKGELAKSSALQALEFCTTGDKFVEVLLRGGLHSTTRVDGQTIQDGPHFTVNFKTEDMVLSGNHIPAHVYVDPIARKVVRVEWFTLCED